MRHLPSRVLPALLQTLLLALTLLLPLAAPARAEIPIHSVTSPGGLTVWLVQDPQLPLVTLAFDLEAGSTEDPPGREGMAEMVAAALVTGGAGERDAAAFTQALEDNAIRLSLSADLDGISGSLQTLTDSQDLAASLLRDALLAPRFEESAVERLRNQALAGLRQALSDPDELAGRAFSTFAFEGHPYARPGGGTFESLRAITVEEMRAWHRARISRGGIRLAAVGDITPEALGALVDRVFLDLPQVEIPPVPKVGLSNAGKLALVRFETPQSVITFARDWIFRADADWLGGTLINHVLGGGGFSSRLTNEVREKRGLTYGIGTYVASRDAVAWLGGSTSTVNSASGQVLGLIGETLTGMSSTPMTEGELAQARTYLVRQLTLRLSNSPAIADLLLQLQKDELGLDYLDRREGLIRGFTDAALQALAGRLLQPERMVTVVVGPGEGLTADRSYTPAELFGTP